MQDSNPEFFKIAISEDSAVGAGQSIKADKEAQQSVAGLKNTLFEVLQVNMDEYKMSYLDNDGEKIRIEDDQDWTTCVEELYSLSRSSFAKGLTIFIERQNGKAVPLTSTTVTTCSSVQDVPPYNPDASQPAPEAAKPPLEDVERSEKVREEAPEDKKPSSSHTSSFSNIPKPLEPPAPVYKFGYSPEELDWIKKVSTSVYSKIEEIFEAKIDSKLIESERAFKQYHQQQLKNRTAHLEKHVEELKVQLLSLQQQIKTQQQQPVPFANALVTNTFVTHPHMMNNFTQPQNLFAAQLPPAKTDQGQRSKYCHLDIGCNECQKFPLKGLRYKALMKRDYDLCEECFLANKDTKEAYLVLQLARAAQLSSYEQRNKSMRRYHNWETEEEAEMRKIEQEADRFTELHYH
jgi:Zinc finger, ZZ type